MAGAKQIFRRKPRWRRTKFRIRKHRGRLRGIRIRRRRRR